MHENYKPKKCPQCDRRFSTKALLEEHVMRSHNPEGILCNDCGKIFSSSKLLKRHELWHQNPEQAQWLSYMWQNFHAQICVTKTYSKSS